VGDIKHRFLIPKVFDCFGFRENEGLIFKIKDLFLGGEMPYAVAESENHRLQSASDQNTLALATKSIFGKQHVFLRPSQQETRKF